VPLLFVMVALPAVLALKKAMRALVLFVIAALPAVLVSKN
jgi:hypothetical protein